MTIEEAFQEIRETVELWQTDRLDNVDTLVSICQTFHNYEKAYDARWKEEGDGFA